VDCLYHWFRRKKINICRWRNTYTFLYIKLSEKEKKKEPLQTNILPEGAIASAREFFSSSSGAFGVNSSKP
jgi:hypothetical protein